MCSISPGSIHFYVIKTVQCKFCGILTKTFKNYHTIIILYEVSTPGKITENMHYTKYLKVDINFLLTDDWDVHSESILNIS